VVVQNNGESTGPGGVTGRGLRSGQSGNPIRPPSGFETLAREAVGDSRHPFDLYVGVLTGDTKALGLRRVALRDRLAAAAWLGEGDGEGRPYR